MKALEKTAKTKVDPKTLTKYRQTMAQAKHSGNLIGARRAKKGKGLLGTVLKASKKGKKLGKRFKKNTGQSTQRTALKAILKGKGKQILPGRRGRHSKINPNR